MHSLQLGGIRLYHLLPRATQGTRLSACHVHEGGVLLTLSKERPLLALLVVVRAITRGLLEVGPWAADGDTGGDGESGDGRLGHLLALLLWVRVVHAGRGKRCVSDCDRAQLDYVGRDVAPGKKSCRA